MKPIQYRGYIYWILMIFGSFLGNIIDGAHSDLFFPILLIIIFAIYGDLISQVIMYFKLRSASKLSVVKFWRNFSLSFSMVWMGILCLPTFIDCFLHEIFVMPLIEFVLIGFLFWNQIRWVAYQVKDWTIKHNLEN